MIDADYNHTVLIISSRRNMLNVSKYKKGIRHPRKAIKYITHQKSDELKLSLNQNYYSRLGYRRFNPKGIDVVEEDWDNLIILDAARAGAFRRWLFQNDTDCQFTTKISRGSQTPEWFAANFKQRKLNDTVYVTGNSVPYDIAVATEEEQMRSYPEYEFDLDMHDMVNVWKETSDGVKLENKRNVDVVTPEQMVDASLNTSQEYPNKRLLIHFTQPHDPYIGEFGQNLHSRFASPLRAYDADEGIHINEVKRAYQENCNLALDAAYSLGKELSGKTVISSDHGELLDDKIGPIPMREVLHPAKLYVPELVQIPWIIIDGERKTIIAEDSPNLESKDITGELEANLEALGYK
jgi:hypothetical protein